MEGTYSIYKEAAQVYLMVQSQYSPGYWGTVCTHTSSASKSVTAEYKLGSTTAEYKSDM